MRSCMCSERAGCSDRLTISRTPLPHPSQVELFGEIVVVQERLLVRVRGLQPQLPGSYGEIQARGDTETDGVNVFRIGVAGSILP